MKRITAEFLRRNDACAEQVRKFKRLFPTGAPVSMRSMEKAIKAGLTISFLEQFTDSEYQRVRAPALAEHERVTAPALAEYERVTAPALAEYERVRAPALAEYERVRATAWAEYQRVSATALVASLLRYKEVEK